MCLQLLIFLFGLSYQTNTNDCILGLAGLTTCSQYPANSSCCDALAHLSQLGCFCNPVLGVLMGTKRVLALAGLSLAPNFLGGCGSIPIPSNFCVPFLAKTYNNGKCSKPDVLLDAERLENTINFQKISIQYQKLNSSCFNYYEFQKSLNQYLTPDIVFTNPYGAATFAGQGEVVEYFGIAYTPINRGLFYTEPTYADPTQDPNSKLYISPDGTKVYLTQTANLFLFNGCSRVDNLYFEEYLQYKECQTIAHYAYNPYYSEVWPDKRPVNLIATIAKYMYYATKEMETIYGIQSICDYHERFCTGENQQFHDFAECVRFMTALPVISPGCGIAGLTGGNSSTCRFKHHTLIPMDPKFHCFHIGYGHREDASGHFKCNDQVECYENYTTNPNLGDPKLIDLTDLTPLDKLCIEQGRAALNPGRPTPNATWNAHSPPNICCITNPYCPSGDQGASELKRRRSIMQ